MSKGVLPNNGQQNDNGDDEDVEVDMLGIRLAEEATDATGRIRGSQGVGRTAMEKEDGARECVAKAVECIYHILLADRSSL
jgi:hypothetical protein